DGHVTGVQTCGLPICPRRRIYSPGHEKNRKSSGRRWPLPRTLPILWAVSCPVCHPTGNRKRPAEETAPLPALKKRARGAYFGCEIGRPSCRESVESRV